MRQKWKAFVVLLMSASKIIFDSDDILKVILVDSHGNQLNIHVQGNRKQDDAPIVCAPRVNYTAITIENSMTFLPLARVQGYF
jgi:hypothetical protein